MGKSCSSCRPFTQEATAVRRIIYTDIQIGEQSEPFAGLRLYRNVRSLRMNRMGNRIMKATECPAGGIVCFGRYWQTSESTPEPIEWRVLFSGNSFAVLTSAFVLDCGPYNSLYDKVNWGVSTLRTWLNGHFLNSAFTPDEQAQLSSIDALGNRRFIVRDRQINKALDKVCLLSVEEANLFFHADEERICQPTPYARKQGVCTSDRNTCIWWLRSPLRTQYYASNVNFIGYIEKRGEAVDSAHVGIRPVIVPLLE